jgi:hypothetical protein
MPSCEASQIALLCASTISDEAYDVLLSDEPSLLVRFRLRSHD